MDDAHGTNDLHPVSARDALVMMEGQEHTLVYFHTDRLVFSVSNLLPGGQSALDPGHVGAHEVAYVVQGKVVMEFPQLGRFVPLESGDGLLIPEGEPHRVFNVGVQLANLVWATAPHLGRPR